MRILSQKPGQAHQRAASESGTLKSALDRRRAAETAMQMPEAERRLACPCGAGCPRCQVNGAHGAHRAVHDVMKSRGQPLDDTHRARLEVRLGHDFSRIRIHHDNAAAESARMVGARAYTYGHHVAFGAGLYRPGTPAGDRLLMHELWHNVQQRQGLTVDTSRQARGPLEREARMVAHGGPVPRVKPGPDVRTPVFQFDSELDALVDAFLEAESTGTTSRVPVWRAGPGGMPIVDFAGLPAHSRRGLLNNIVSELLSTEEGQGRATLTSQPRRRPGFGPASMEAAVNAARPGGARVMIAGSEVTVYLRQPATSGQVLVRVNLNDEAGLLRNALSRQEPLKERIIHELIQDTIGHGSAGSRASFRLRAEALPVPVRVALSRQQPLPATWPENYVPPARNVPQSIRPLPTPAPTTFNYRLLSRTELSNGTVVLELEWEMIGEAPPVNQVLESRGVNPLPRRGQLRILVDAAGDVLETGGSNLPREIEVAIAREAVAGRPGLATGRASALGRWTSRILLTVSVIQGVADIVNAPEGQRLRTGAGMAGGFALPYVVCNLALGATGLSGVVCSLAAGAVGAQAGALAADVVESLPSLPQQVPGIRRPGGRVQEHLERDRARLAQARAARPPVSASQPGSGGEVSAERRIESPGGRSLAALISDIGRLTPSGAREAARHIERALERAPSGGQAGMLVSGGPSTDEAQVLIVTLPLNGYFPDGARFEIRAFELPLLLSRTRLLAVRPGS